jgi:hypothetical protein
MCVTAICASQMLAGKKPVWGLLLSLALAQMACAGTSVSPPSQTVTLYPAPAPPLRIDFNYNFQKACLPFQKNRRFPEKKSPAASSPPFRPLLCSVLSTITSCA